MRRAWFLVVSLLIIPLAQDADAVPTLKTIKPGSTCTRLNQTQVINSLRYTCVKSGKKLIWSKGVKILSPSKTSGKNEDINQEENPYMGVKVNWDNLEKLNDIMVYQNWNEWTTAKSQADLTKIKREIIYSPNVKVTTVNPDQVFDRLEKIFSWAELPTQYRVLYFTKKDEEWAKNKYKELYSVNNEIELSSCRNYYCVGGAVSRENKQIIHMNISRDYDLAPLGTFTNTDSVGGLEAHEFVHVVQFGYAKGYRDLAVPGWIIEGGATYFSTLALAENREAYMYMRYRNSQTFRYAPEVITQRVMDLLNGSKDSHFSYNYTLGYFLTEVITGIYGLNSTFKLIENTSKMESFESAFRFTFNEEWESVKPKLAQAVKHQIMLRRGF